MDIFVNVLLWGCESWALTLIQAKKIRVFYRRCLWYMLRITVCHKVRNNALLELAAVDDVISTMRLRPFWWINKLAHISRTRIPCQLFSTYVIDKSKNSNRLRVWTFQIIAHWYNVTLRALSVSKDNYKFIQSLTGIVKQSEE